MNVETFRDELTRRIGRDFRLVRSLDKPRWRIEQKVRRAVDFPGSSDQMRMLGEGYHLVLESPDSDTSRCPRCATLLSLPLFEKAEFVCPTCKALGHRKHTLIGGYFPLVERTLVYLERSHWTRSDAYMAEIHEENRQLARARERDVAAVARDLASEHANRILGISQFSYNSRRGTPNAWGGTYLPPSH